MRGMGRLGKAILTSLLLVVICSGATACIGTPSPVTNHQTFTVGPGQANAVLVSVNAGDRLTGSFSISGGSGNDIGFSTKDPLGNITYQAGRVSTQWQFDLVCASTGSYQLVFDNGFSIVSNKAIDLTTTVVFRFRWF